MAEIVFERGKAKAWKKARSSSGTCFSVSFDQLVAALRLTGCLNGTETVEKIAVNEYGVTVFTGGKNRVMSDFAAIDRVQKLRK